MNALFALAFGMFLLTGGIAVDEGNTPMAIASFAAAAIAALGAFFATLNESEDHS